MRVATRRLRAALGLFGAHLDGAEAEVRRLGGALGRVRDLDVQIEWLAAACASAPASAARGIARLLDERRAELPAEERGLSTTLARWVGEIAPRLEQLFATVEHTGRLGGGRTRRALRRRLRQLDERLDIALPSAEAWPAHRLRITVKKLRYESELCAAAFPDETSAILGALVPLQETLGQLHDRDVRVPLVERFLVHAGSDDEPGAVALLREAIGDRDRLAAEVLVELRRWDAERLAESLARALS
jgi:CHAD domain-containing protein